MALRFAVLAVCGSADFKTAAGLCWKWKPNFSIFCCGGWRLVCVTEGPGVSSYRFEAGLLGISIPQ